MSAGEAWLNILADTAIRGLYTMYISASLHDY